MNKNAFSETYIPKDYPVPLIRMLHEHFSKHRVSAEYVVGWQELVHINNAEWADHQGKSRVAHMIGNAASDRVTIYQDQTHKEGRLYQGTVYVMNGTDFLEALYHAYTEGISMAKSRFDVNLQ